MRRFTGIAILIGILLTGGRAQAIDWSNDFDYSGPIDIFTGQAPESSGVDTSNVPVTMEDGSTYDRKTGRFVYSIGDGSVSVSVADGMIVTEEVQLSGTEHVEAVVYRDGEELSGIPESVSKAGTYVVMDNTTEGGVQCMSFRIVKSITSNLASYVMPPGFFVKSVYRGNDEVMSDYGTVDLTEEGHYDISYHCTANSLDYSLSVTIDNTPPQVTFEGVDEKDVARGPVTVKGLAEGDAMTITLDGEETKPNLYNQLTRSGDYTVIVTDPAGNIQEKEFHIMVYLNMQAWMFIGVILILIVSLMIVLTVTRQRLKVR